MRRKLITTCVLVAALLVVLLPVTQLMEKAKDHADRSAEALVQPILNIHHQVMADQEAVCVPVGALIELEEAWEIEDTREESEVPLVTAMLNGGDVLGFDYAQNTFYCTIGMENDEAWPELSLQARNVPEGLRIRLIDDYTYDWCADAIRDGYRYEMIAYTESQYSYFGIVFTGLPMVTLHVKDGVELTDEYVPMRVSVAANGYEPVESAGQIHTRGGGFKRLIDKKSYRIEFHTINEKGRDKQQDHALLGMEADSDWLLVGNPTDENCVRNHLCWEMWRNWNKDGYAPMLLDSQLVEVFLNDEYIGIYQLMQRVDVEEEIVKMGGNLNTDYAFRVIREPNIDPARPHRSYMELSNLIIESRYAPPGKNANKTLDLIDDYAIMNRGVQQVDDAEFIRMVEEHVDIEALISYWLFFHAVELSDDNVHNNLYIWATRENGKYIYRLSPWDMDYGLSSRTWDEGKVYGIDLTMFMTRRILDLNLSNSRQMIHDLWKEKRATILTDDAVYQWIHEKEELLNASGAYLRESERWYGEAKELDLALISGNEVEHMYTVERFLNELWPVQ